MRKSKKTLIIIILTIIILFTVLVNTSEAASTFWSDIFKDGKNFLSTGKSEAEGENGMSDMEVRNIMDDLYSIIFPLGVVITVIVGGVLGIKFMLASAEEKAEIKKSMVPYVAGCIVIYGAYGIWRICIQLFSVLS